MKDEILLIGGGGHCKSVIDVIETAETYTIVGIIDRKELIGHQVLGYKIIGCDEDLSMLVSRYPNALITVGQIRNANVRIKLYGLLVSLGYNLPVVVSPRAYVSKHAVLGKGTIVLHDALINAQARIGDNCIINSKALIEHDCKIGNHCHISTGAVLNGATQIGSGTFIGSTAVSKEGSNVPESSFIKAGSIIK